MSGGVLDESQQRRQVVAAELHDRSFANRQFAVGDRRFAFAVGGHHDAGRVSSLNTAAGFAPGVLVVLHLMNSFAVSDTVSVCSKTDRKRSVSRGRFKLRRPMTEPVHTIGVSSGSSKSITTYSAPSDPWKPAETGVTQMSRPGISASSSRWLRCTLLTSGSVMTCSECSPMMKRAVICPLAI